MKAVSQDYKNAIKEFGRELDSKLTYTDNGTTTTLGVDDLNLIEPHYNGDILKSVMKVLEVDSDVNIPLGTEINYQFGVKVSGTYEYVDYGNYIVYSSEKQEDTNSYKLVCYDKMLYAMKKYESFATYPISVKDYINTLCTQIGLTFKNANETFFYYSAMIPKELYLGKNSDNSDFTYRDVLDDLAQITCSTICINSNDELELKYLDSNKNIYMPYRYRELPNISGNNTFSIGTSLNSIKSIEIKFSIPNTPTTTFDIFSGYIYQTSNSFDLWYIPSTNKFRIHIGNTYYNSSAVNLTTNTKHSIKIDRQHLYFDENTIFTTSSMWSSTLSLVGLVFFGSDTTNVYEIITETGSNINTYTHYYIPVIDTINDRIGMFADNNFHSNTYTGELDIETIGTDYFNDTNVNFSEVYGPINTITLKDSNNNIISSFSNPSNIAEENKKELIITDNILMEQNISNPEAILRRLYGLTYCLNDYKSTGITWLELCDRYKVQLEIPNEDGTNRTATYDCIMLNDDVQIDQDIIEDVYTEEPFQSQMEYRNLQTISTLSGFQIEKDSFNNSIEYEYTNRTSPLGNLYSYNADDIEGSTIASTSYSSMTADEKAAFLQEYGFASEALMYDKWDINNSGTIDSTDINSITTFVNDNEPSNIEINSGSSDNSPNIILGGKYSTEAVVIDNEGNIELNKYENGTNYQTRITPKQIELGANGLKTLDSAGFTTDRYGNLHHQRATASDELEFYDNSGNIKARFIWESGNLKLNGSIEASGGYVAKEITNENILTLKPGLYYKEGSTGWTENGWPLATWHATLKVSGTAYDDNNGYRVLEVYSTENGYYRKVQSWGSWGAWTFEKNTLQWMTNGDDFNNYQIEGFYLGNGTTNVSNAPENMTTIDGLVKVERPSAEQLFVLQTYYGSNGTIYKRMNWFGAFWTGWLKL